MTGCKNSPERKETKKFYSYINIGNHRYSAVVFKFMSLCYEKCSPLGVPLYAFGYPFAYASVHFFNSEQFFLSLFRDVKIAKTIKRKKRKKFEFLP